MKKTLKWLGISLSIIIGLIGIAVLLFLFLLTPKRLTPIVNKYSTEFLNAKVTFDSVQVSLFEEFPKVSVKLVGGEIISHALQSDTAFLSVHPENADTLIRFKEFMISLNIRDLLQSKVNIQRIRISQPEIYAYISPSGQANWDIITLPESSDTPLDLNVDRFSIRGPAKLNFKSVPGSITLQASIGRLFLRGFITPDFDKLEIDRFVCSKVDVKANIERSDISARLILDSARIAVVEPRQVYDLNIAGAASATIENQAYCDSLPLSLTGTLKLDFENFNSFGFKDFGLTVAHLPEIKLNGDILLSEGDITSDLACKIEGLPIQSLLDLIPKGFSEEIQKIQTNTKINLNTNVKGKYEFTENGKLPVVNIDFKIPKGHLIYKDLESKIDNIAIDASFHFNPANPKKTGIKLRNFDVEAFAVTLNGNMDITNLFDDPEVTLKINGSANLRELQKFAPEDLGITARGNISFNAEGSFLLSRLNPQDLAQNDLVVQFSADRVRVRMPKESISLLAEKTFLELNTTKTRTNRNTGAVTRLLSIDLKSDTARVRMPNRETIAVSKLNFDMRTSDALITGDTSSKVIPMVGNVTANTLEYSDVDSTTMRLREVKTNFRILPSRENRSLPSIRFEIETKQLSALSEGNRLSARDASISIVATKNTPPQGRQRTAQRSAAVAQPSRTTQQSNRRVDDFAGEDIDIKNTELGALLREWTVDGNIKSRTGRVVSPYFPLRIRLQNLDVAFTTNDITLQNLAIRCGQSRLNITGKVDGIRRALSTGRGLTLVADIKADTLNVNELFTAMYNGTAYANASEEYKKAIAAAQDEEQLEQIIQNENEGKETSALIVVPSNITVDVKVDVGYGKYADITIDKLTGALVLRDRCIQLKDVTAKTSVGEIDLTALYATRSKKDITFGIDLDFKNIQVEDFISIIPSVDSLVPMLASFKGLVNCQVAATASLDTTMNIILPSLNAACRVNGTDLVLLDGATFSEIARMLKFKNREKNLVEHISVELLINNNQIEIFPFIMQIDRYKTAISGIHNLDMTFNYHVSVLKSPIPFRVGINLRGDLNNMNKMKFGIGKAKYKDTNLPTYVTVIDTTRLNLRTQINNFIQHGVDVARFSQFSAPAINPAFIEKDVELLSAKDSLTLYKEGIIDVAPTSVTDSVPSGEQQGRRRRGGGERNN
ncbi:MAG: AsmA family protein [Lentimicrobiaceae bacterium]|nr:AsmA family protein [Lentimicrobiaceae bacterium]